jgi:hypothetical protein
MTGFSPKNPDPEQPGSRVRSDDDGMPKRPYGVTTASEA